MSLNTRTKFVIICGGLVLSVATIARGEAGLSEMARVRCFWVIPPCAILWEPDGTEPAELFMGYHAPWYDFITPGGIERIGWSEWSVDGVEEYGVHGLYVYGTTIDGRWFLAYTSGGMLPRYFDNIEDWRQKIIAIDGPSEPVLITVEEGYRSAMRAIWLKRIIVGILVVTLFSLPWIILIIQKRKWKRRLLLLTEQIGTADVEN
ncbi:MAG: hypothetical protein KAV00_15400 [Phycisphaerae bacterium]|nr:hypothetical protein [Phycisphaerae bacterium]